MKSDTSSFVLLSQSCFGYLGSFVVPHNFRILKISAKMSLEFWSGLQRICRVLWERDILTLLILLIHEHEISFHSFLSFSIYFINTLYFSVYISFFSLVKSHRFLEGLTARCSGLSDQVQALLSGSSDLLLAPPRLLKRQLPPASPAPQVTATREGDARPPASWCPHGTFRTLARLTSYF